MEFELKPLASERIASFKKDMQDAFQKGAEAGFGEMYEEILPESHIDRSLNTKGSAAYEAFADGVSAGGAIVVIDEATQHNHLDFLYVKTDVQSKGIGFLIWQQIEKLYPQTKIWETCTPYFEKRNIHFYINRCGFKAVEFFNKFHPDPNDTDDCFNDDNYFEGMFRFEKDMNK